MLSSDIFIFPFQKQMTFLSKYKVKDMRCSSW